VFVGILVEALSHSETDMSSSPKSIVALLAAVMYPTPKIIRQLLNLPAVHAESFSPTSVPALPLPDESLALAKKAYAEERQRPATPPPAGAPGGAARFGAGAELGAVYQLMLTTKEQQYIDRFNELIWPALDAPGGRNLVTAVRALPYLGPGAVEKLRPYVVKYKAEVDALSKANPYGVPIATGGWAGSGGVMGWAATNYHLSKVYPDLFDRETVLRGMNFLFGTHPASNTSLVATVGTRSKTLAYGNNRADFSFIPGVVVPGVLILKPDYPENMDDWPFLWGENEGTVGGASQYLFLANAAQELLKK